ncbi:nicotinamide N-methyltransferase [Rhodotorula toruloides]|uniref:Nicotinamide N-methyltransferase n=1 Tax=Rhodotorula toruloides TaxID=5286 RepID=A0A511KBZ2_RHOTO|nr:nicotinamide N-methyltransferase [Rhodotorula toruloides]
MSVDEQPPRSPSPDDALEFFAESLETLYDHHVPAKGNPLALFTFTPPSSSAHPEPLTVRLPPQQVNELFAHFVWNSGLRMADALATGRIHIEREQVLELGAGAGIPGLIAARMGANRIVLSDYDDPLLITNLRDNIALAFPNSPAVRERIRAVGHSWGDPDSLKAILDANSPSSSPFPHILLADTIWNSSGHALLLSSLQHLLARTAPARIHICAGFHSGRATVRAFLKKAEKIGFVQRGEWQEIGVDGRRRKWGWDVIGDEEEWEEKENASERNKWVVEGDLGWNEEALRDGTDARIW